MNKQTLISALLAAAVALVISWGMKPAPHNAERPQRAQSVYERVSSSKTLRCGYITWPPFSSKDSATGKVTGFYVDLTEELAKGYGWKVEWVEEVALGDFVASLNSGRIDMLCAPLAPVQQRTQWAYFSTPHFFAPINAYVRADNVRFDDAPEGINAPDVKLSTMEGELSSILARTVYPKAQVVEITSQQGNTQLFENVVTGKADIILQDPFSFDFYDRSNPGKLKLVPGATAGVFSAAFSMKFGEDAFKAVIDAGLGELQNRGYLKKIWTDYDFGKFNIYLPADGYKTN